MTEPRDWTVAVAGGGGGIDRASRLLLLLLLFENGGTWPLAATKGELVEPVNRVTADREGEGVLSVPEDASR
ncbi:hypothetical protein DFJ73DRAFT_835092, partial [Zopfochytrium polystomum]